MVVTYSVWAQKRRPRALALECRARSLIKNFSLRRVRSRSARRFAPAASRVSAARRAAGPVASRHPTPVMTTVWVCRAGRRAGQMRSAPLSIVETIWVA